MTDAALLHVENLSVAYGATCAVDAVSLELHPGRCLGVIGESGAGKTQAFLAMMGLLPPQAHVSGRARLVRLVRANVDTPLAVSLYVVNAANCGPMMLCHVPLARMPHQGSV